MLAFLYHWFKHTYASWKNLENIFKIWQYRIQKHDHTGPFIHFFCDYYRISVHSICQHAASSSSFCFIIFFFYNLRNERGMQSRMEGWMRTIVSLYWNIEVQCKSYLQSSLVLPDRLQVSALKDDIACKLAIDYCVFLNIMCKRDLL